MYMQAMVYQWKEKFESGWRRLGEKCLADHRSAKREYYIIVANYLFGWF